MRGVPKPLIHIMVVLLVVAAFPVPYGYYSLLKIMACGVFIWAAIISHSKGGSYLPWIFVVLIVLFNPIIPVYLSKELWIPVDVGAAIFLLLSMKSLEKT